MWQWLSTKLREWPILVAALVLLIGGISIVAYREAPAPPRGAEAVHTAVAPAGAPEPAAARAAPAVDRPAHATPPAAAAPRMAEKPPASVPAQSTAGVETAARTAPPARAPTGASAEMAGDPVAGRQVYRKCQACHSLEPGKNMLGPSLAGVVGRKAGTLSGFSYSPAMKESGLVWDVPALDRYLANPQKVVPGNRMPFPGLKTEHERVDVVAYLVASSGGPAPPASAPAAAAPAGAAPAAPAPGPVASAPAANTAAASGAQEPPSPSYIPDARYTLRSGIAEGRMVYLGVGGSIDGKVNPVLTAAEGQVVQLTLINGEGATHDVVFPDQDAKSPRVTGSGASTTIAFRAAKAGDFIYFCSVPGHQLAGMQGAFIVTPKPAEQTVVEADISHEPSDLPPPIGRREPQTVRVDLVSVELEGRLAEGTTFGYWTFNGRVPGPFIRVRVGDTIEIHLKNSADSSMIHSVDFHAATGPGGGAASLQVDPGEEKSMTWKALTPGLYVYHCATPMVAEHIANGMYGLILVEPEGGLPPVDREFYVMQGEIYTDAAFGQHGSQQFSVEKLLNEKPEYFVFNGSVGALSKLHPMHAKVGETVRIFFGVGGPNFTSSFHVIGEIFDKVYQYGGVTTPPLEGIQTVTVPAGGAVITEFKVDVPGNYTMVDHALARAERGLLGMLTVEGPSNTDIYNGVVMPGMGH
jgi:nitrite reductase (NO-forming)